MKTYTPISYTKYDYYQPCEQLPIIYDDLTFSYDYLGRDVEVFEENVKINENNLSLTIDTDFQWVFIPFPPFALPLPSGFPMMGGSNYFLSTNVINKVIRYPAIQKSVTRFADGIISTTENVALSNKTGFPVITRTTDEFDELDLGLPSNKHDGSIFSKSDYALDNYPNFSHKSLNEGYYFFSGDKSIYLNKIYKNNEHFLQIDKNSSNCDDLNQILNSGDLIELFSSNHRTRLGYYYVSELNNDLIQLYPIINSTTNNFTTTTNNNNIAFRVVRSGKNNKINEIAGNTLIYGQKDETSINKKLPFKPTRIAYDNELNEIINKRKNFVSWLNYNLYLIKNSGPNDGTLTYIVSEDLYPTFIGNNGLCDKVPNIEIIYNYDPITNMFILKFKKWDDNLNITFEKEVHPLVNDLNELFNNAWSKNLFPDLINDYEELKNNNLCELCTSDQYSSFNAFTFHLTKDKNYLREKSENLIGLKKILETEYDINGTIKLGSEIFQNKLIENNPLDGDYATFFYNVKDASSFFTYPDENIKIFTGRVYLSYFNDNSEEKYIELCRQTDPYYEECFSNDWNTSGICRRNNPKNYNAIGVPIDLLLRPLNKSFIIAPFNNECYSKDKEGVNNVIENNNKFFDIFLTNNLSFTNDIGYFFENNGMLCFFKKENEMYPNDEIVELFRIRDSNSINLIANNYCEIEISGNDSLTISEYDGNQIRLGSNINSCEDFCLKFCPDIYPQYKWDGVLKAEAFTFNNNWSRTQNSPSYNPYLSGTKGKWKISNSYVYEDEIVSGNNYDGVSSNTIFDNAGVINDYRIFNWKNNKNNNWYDINKVVNYDENGVPIESINDKQIYSSKYVNEVSLPLIISNNSKSNCIFFSGFEDSPLSSSNTSHTGNKSLDVSTDILLFSDVKMNEDDFKRGFNVKCWINRSDVNPKVIIKDISHSPILNISIVKKLTIGDWSLYEGNGNLSISPPTATNFKISIDGNGDAFSLDDIKISPIGSQNNCFVYDNDDYKVIATFDDQHFPIIYQYNPKGELIRKILETEVGRKTLNEGFINKLKIDRTTSNDYSIPKPSIQPPKIDDLNKNVKFKQPKFSLTKEEIKNLDSLSSFKIKESLLDINLKPGSSSYRIFDSYNKLDSIFKSQHMLDTLKKVILNNDSTQVIKKN